MDPNAALAKLVKLAETIAERDENPARDFYDACELAELALAMHDWMRRGGFAPDAWKAGAK